MEVLRPFRYWTLSMRKRHTVTLHHVVTVYNDIFDHMDGMMRALAKKMTLQKEDLFFAVMRVRQKLSKYYSEVTPKMGMVLISAHILDPFRNLRLVTKWDQGMDINPENETSYTAQYHEACLKYVENEYCAKNQHVLFKSLETVPNSNLVPSATRPRCYQSSFDPHDLSSDEKEYVTANNVPETTPGRSNRTARLFTATRLYLNSPPEAPENREQSNPNINEYLSDPVEISITFWIPDIPDWWR